MIKHRRNLLLLLLGAIVSGVLFLFYDTHKLFVAWFWTVQDTFAILGKTWVLRRMLRPVTVLATRWIIIDRIGFSRFGKLKRVVSTPIVRAFMFARALLPRLNLFFRILVLGAATVVLACLVFITWLVPYLLPATGFVAHKLYWWMSDQLFDRMLLVFRWRATVNRIVHRSKILQLLMSPYRWLRLMVEPRLERRREKRLAKKQDHS